jgi:hypothetical protein
MANSEVTDSLLQQTHDVRRGAGLVSFAAGLLKGGNFEAAAAVLAIASRVLRRAALIEVG